MSRCAFILFPFVALLGCTSSPVVQTASVRVAPSEETLSARRSLCEAVYNRAVDFTMQRRMHDEGLSFTVQEYAANRERWKDRMDETVLVSFTAQCMSESTRSRLECALRAPDIRKMQICIEEADRSSEE